MTSTKPLGLFDTTYRSWITGRIDDAVRYRIQLPRGRQYDLTIGEVFCCSCLESVDLRDDPKAWHGVFQRILDWNGDILITEVLATAFYGRIRFVKDLVLPPMDPDFPGKIGAFEPSTGIKSSYYFLFMDDVRALLRDQFITVPHLYRVGMDRSVASDFIGRYFFRFNQKTEYDMVDRMSYEEMLISPFRWIREWATINAENRILYDVDPSIKDSK